MLYIHQLKDLTPKSAEIESIPVIREIKTRTPVPLKEANVREYFELFFISESEKRHMTLALELIPKAVDEIDELLKANDHDFEAINLQRAIAMLKEIPPFLLNNLNYAKEISAWQENFVAGFAPLFNELPKIKSQSQQEREAVNAKLNNIFEKLLRNDEFSFNYKDVISEGQLSRARDLYEIMEKGFFFHVLLEEEIKKQSFDLIKSRLSPEKLRKVDAIRMEVGHIKKGVESAYDMNMRMLQWALTVYGYVKWLTGK